MLLAFSVLYTVNIAVSNQSLQMVTIPFHQVVRSTTPLFTIVLSCIILRTRFSLRKLISLIPVVAGVALATYGDYYFTVAGLLLTLLGTVLAALKTICTNLLQVPPTPPPKMSLGTPATTPLSSNAAGWNAFRLQNKLHPLDLLLRMSPLAFIQCVLYAQASGELDRVRAFSAVNMTRGNLLGLLVNGMIAFGLNVVSFTANKKTGALTMTVAGESLHFPGYPDLGHLMGSNLECPLDAD
jgi:drug/metabolite transporter (DMT)-like permease